MQKMNAIGDLARITFTGVDDRTDLDRVRRICSEQTFLSQQTGAAVVEFAVLVSPSKAGTERRYPKHATAIARKIPNRAIHLCGEASRRILAGQYDITGMMDFMDMPRIQVNARVYDEHGYDRLRHYGVALRTDFIVQSQLDPIPFIRGLSVLADRSRGTGVLPATWPTAVSSSSRGIVGYAGGLTPINISDELIKIATARGFGKFAVDIETGVRADDDWFDLDLVEQTIDAVRGWERGAASRGNPA